MPLLRIEWSILLHTTQQKAMLFSVPDSPQNCPPSRGGSRHHRSNTRFLGPTWVSPTNGISIGQAVLHSSLVWPTHRHQTTLRASSVAIGRILCTACRRCGPKCLFCLLLRVSVCCVGYCLIQTINEMKWNEMKKGKRNVFLLMDDYINTLIRRGWHCPLGL